MTLLALHAFFLQLGAGLAAGLFLTRRRSLGVGFHQLHLAIVFVAVLLSVMGADEAAAWGARRAAGAPGVCGAVVGEGRTLLLAAAALTLVATFLYSFRVGPAVVLHAAAAVLAGLHLGALFVVLGWGAAWPAGGGAAGALLFVAGGLTGAAVLALATLAMNVGHWYLVNPHLGIGHLGVPTLLLFLLLLPRGFLLVVGGAATVATMETEGRTLAGLILAHGFFEGARVVVGWLVPLGLAWMAVKTAELRATQSATGILYALLVLVAIGEALGTYLTVVRGIAW